MTSAEEIKNRVVLGNRKKALPLARLLIKAAAEHGATLRDLEAACDAVLEIYRDGLSICQLEIVQDKCEATFERITEGLDATAVQEKATALYLKARAAAMEGKDPWEVISGTEQEAPDKGESQS